ncbi:unnamed protein product [Bemisia tabaci]|uniref:Uncharacterized protein n=1 Tax=Bemisia tabaci TaxID=7038 RepID=A0A9P0ACZ8_BEMTA|nr:unnamed protein product [Bemisia tabaci]
MVTVQMRGILSLLSFFALANDLTYAAGSTGPDFDVMAYMAELSQMLSSGNATEIFAPGSKFSKLSLAFLEKSDAYVKSLQKGDTELISNQSQPINSTDSSNGTQVSNPSDSSPNSSAEMGPDLSGFSEGFPPDIMNLSLNGSIIGLNLTNMTGLANYIDNMFALNNPDLQALNWSISDFQLNTNSFDQEGPDGINTSDFEPVITNQGGLSNLTNQGGPSNLTTGDLLLESDGADFSSKELPADETSSLDGSRFNNTSLVDPVRSPGETPENGSDLSSQGSSADETGSLDGSPLNNVTSADQDDALSGPPGEPLAQLNGTGSSDQ